jgi:hypothetical protein
MGVAAITVVAAIIANGNCRHLFAFVQKGKQIAESAEFYHKIYSAHSDDSVHLIRGSRPLIPDDHDPQSERSDADFNTSQIRDFQSNWISFFSRILLSRLHDMHREPVDPGWHRP